MSIEIPVVITRTEYERLLGLQSSMEVLQKRLAAAEAAVKTPVQGMRFSDYEFGLGRDPEGDSIQRVKFKTKDGLTCVSDKAYPVGHDRIRTAIAPSFPEYIASANHPFDTVKVEYRNYQFAGVCRKTGMRVFEEV